jgi:hypothetical protein
MRSVDQNNARNAEPENSRDDLSNSGPVVRQESEGWELGPSEDRTLNAACWATVRETYAEV